MIINVGDEILVNCSAYGVAGLHWCRVELISPGTASVYPYKARVPDRGLGQWRLGEVQEVRRALRDGEVIG